eukprot:TRINITY_DN7927_c0_g1_i2.p1 TRINITY_DN7927_c0_g1~~TRINITY_DN7927_c0_g1_i2.p1  ORF type:complete len:530 (-),score=123.24 TRINITY_DN7927_c0_g1_i2:169-1758(-)
MDPKETMSSLPPPGTAVEVMASTTGNRWTEGTVVDPLVSGKVTVEFEHDGVIYRKSLNPDSTSLRWHTDDDSLIMSEEPPRSRSYFPSTREKAPTKIGRASAAERASARPSRQVMEHDDANAAAHGKAPWTPLQLAGRSDVNFEESIRRWLAALPISKDIKDAISDGDVPRTRRLLKDADILPVANERSLRGDTQPLIDETKAFMHFAVMCIGSGGNSSTSASIMGVAAMLASEMKQFLGYRIACRRIGGVPEYPGPHGPKGGSDRHVGPSLPDYERPTHEGGSLLSFAVQLAQHRTVELLLSYCDEVEIGLNANDSMTVHHGFPAEYLPSTPFKLAVGRDDLVMMQMLEKAGAKVGGTELALRQKELRCAKYLLENYSTKKLGLTDRAVALLVADDNLDAVRMLLRANGGSHGKVIGHNCVLCACPGTVSLALLEEVLNASATVLGKNQEGLVHEGRTPLIIVAAEADSATEMDALKKVKLLLRHGCNPLSKCNAGWTASQYASENKLDRLANFLEGAEATFRQSVRN